MGEVQRISFYLLSLSAKAESFKVNSSLKIAVFSCTVSDFTVLGKWHQKRNLPFSV
jgi:hypothetical protein